MSKVSCHVVLVGLPGAGKSSVGRLVAKMMDVKFLDVDEENWELSYLEDELAFDFDPMYREIA